VGKPERDLEDVLDTVDASTLFRHPTAPNRSPIDQRKEAFYQLANFYGTPLLIPKDAVTYIGMKVSFRPFNRASIVARKGRNYAWKGDVAKKKKEKCGVQGE